MSDLDTHFLGHALKLIEDDVEPYKVNAMGHVTLSVTPLARGKGQRPARVQLPSQNISRILIGNEAYSFPK